MTPMELTILISGMCGIQDTDFIQYIPRNAPIEQKIECSEFFVNCMVKSGGEIDIAEIKECSHEWRFLDKLKQRDSK